MSASVVCSLLVHHMFPHSNCHLHAQVLSSHGGRLLLFHGWVSGESDPSACCWYSGCTYVYSAQGYPGLLLLPRRPTRRQPQWCTTSGGLKKTEQAKHSIETEARPLAPRCVTTPCTTVPGSQHIGASNRTAAP